MGESEIYQIGNEDRRPVIGFFPGVFDIIHPGHIRAFKEAKEYCDILIVGIQSDPTIDRPHKNKPIMTLEERKEILGSIKYIDEIIDYETEEDLRFLDKKMKVDIRFRGKDKMQESPYPTKAKMVHLKRNHNYSSTEIRNRIKNYDKSISNG